MFAAPFEDLFGDDCGEPKRVCVTDIRRIYGLKDAEIAHLKCRKRKNPYHRNAAPMRLYLKSEFKEVFEKKRERQQYEADHREEIQAAKDAAAQAKLDECAATIRSWRPPKPFQYSSGTKLPLDVWEKILMDLCNDLEPEGVRGPSVVARDIINVSLTCKELHAASGQAFRHLSKSCPAMPGDTDELWSKFLRNPDCMVLTDVKKLAKQVAVKVSQKKPLLVTEVVQSLGVSKPTSLPARLLKAVCGERRNDFWDYPDLYALCNQVPALKKLTADMDTSIFKLRIAFQELGIQTERDLRALADVKEKERKARERRNAEKQREKIRLAQMQRKEELAKARLEMEARVKASQRARQQAHAASAVSAVKPEVQVKSEAQTPGNQRAVQSSGSQPMSRLASTPTATQPFANVQISPTSAQQIQLGPFASGRGSSVAHSALNPLGLQAASPARPQAASNAHLQAYYTYMLALQNGSMLHAMQSQPHLFNQPGLASLMQLLQQSAAAQQNGQSLPSAAAPLPEAPTASRQLQLQSDLQAAQTRIKAENAGSRQEQVKQEPGLSSAAPKAMGLHQDVKQEPKREA